jgi:O-antigen ligase/tetratricopeptide (TPR) repeat protein
VRVRDWASWVGLTASIAAAVLLVGGAFRWAQACVAFFAFGTLAIQLTSRRALSRLSPLLATLLLAGVMTAIALVPLPEAVRGQLDPVGVAMREDGAELIGVETPSVLARDVSGTTAELVFFVILAAVAVAALRLAPSERGRARLLASVAGTCAVAAIVGGLHELVGAKQLYGMYTVHRANPTILAPLLNENHFGSLMALGACVSVGLSANRRLGVWPRASFLVTTLVCAGTAAASGSRGALIALVVGGGVTAATLAAQRFAPEPGRAATRRSFLTSSLPLSVVGICVVVTVIYAGAGKVSQELDQTTFQEIEQPRSKFAAWRSARELIEESPWVGVTRGGFESSFTRVHSASGTVTFSHLENEYLQGVIDWGIPGALLIGAALLWFWLSALRRWRDGSMTAGALGGLAAIAVHSTVDYGVELLGVAIPVTVVAATVSYVPLRENIGSRTRAFALRIAQLAGLAAAALLLFSNRTKPLREDHAQLAHGDHALAKAQELVRRHPLDYLAFASAASAAHHDNPAQAIRLLNHALLLNPNHPDLHRMTARILFDAKHTDQAQLEYEIAIRHSASPASIIAEVAARYSAEDAARALPADIPNLAPILEPLHELHRDDIISAWFARVLLQRPQDVSICNIVYEHSIQRGDLRTAELVGRKCVALLPDHQTRLSLANLLVSKGSYSEAVLLVADVDSWAGRIDEKASAWFLLCDARTALQQLDEAKTCLRQLDRSGVLPIEQRAAISSRLEQIEQKRREPPATGSAQGSSSTTPAPVPSSPPAPTASPR